MRPKMCHCTISTGIIVTSCVYSFPTDKIFSLFRNVQFSVSYFIYLFILQCLLFSSSKYVQNRINRYGRNAICACSAYACIPGGGGGVLGRILMGVCRWDSETLNLYQTTFMSFLQPYSRLDAKNPYPIPD